MVCGILLFLNGYILPQDSQMTMLERQLGELE